MPRYQDIPQFVDTRCNYEIDIGWQHLRKFVFESDENIELFPDFQRGHVWTSKQKERYLEYRLRGGSCANNLIFACEGFNSLAGSNPWYLVDGFQRLTAVLDFMDDQVSAFGHRYSQYTDGLNIVDHRFHVKVVDIDRKGMLQLYLDLNAGGTPHATTEIQRVQKMLEKEAKHGTH